MRFDETDLELFRHIAEAGSITRGAARANLALTAASARIRNMEVRLGVLLLERRRHGVILSPAGRVLIVHARRMLAQADRLREELGMFQGGLAGHVRLFANTNSYASYLPAVLGPFLLSHPQIDIRIAERPSEAIIGLVADGTAAIGVVAAETDLAGLTAHPIATDRYVAIACRGHPIAETGRASFADTIAFDFIAGPSHALFTAKAQRLGKQIRTRVQMRDDAQVCQLAASGVGIGIVPLSIAASVGCASALTRIELSDAWTLRPMHACVRDRETLSRPAQLLFDHLAQSSGPPSPPAGKENPQSAANAGH